MALLNTGIETCEVFPTLMIFIDSRATKHMTGDANSIQDLQAVGNFQRSTTKIGDTLAKLPMCE